MRMVLGRLLVYFIFFDDMRMYCMKECVEVSMYLYFFFIYLFVFRFNFFFWNYKIESFENEIVLVYILVFV